MHLIRRGEPDATLFKLLRAAVRTPDQTEGDVWAQVTGLDLMERRLQELMDEMPERTDEYASLLLDNEIFLARTRNVGIITPEDAINGSLSGPALRGSGVPWDLRKAEPYCVYDRFDFDVPVGTVRSRLSNARLALRRSYAAQNGESSAAE